MTETATKLEQAIDHRPAAQGISLHAAQQVGAMHRAREPMRCISSFSRMRARKRLVCRAPFE